jgi:hypothetical protein
VRLHNKTLATSLGAPSIPIGGQLAPNSTVGDKALVIKVTRSYFTYKEAQYKFFNFIH